jgi:hypothetical protein
VPARAVPGRRDAGTPDVPCYPPSIDGSEVIVSVDPVHLALQFRPRA